MGKSTATVMDNQKAWLAAAAIGGATAEHAAAAAFARLRDTVEVLTANLTRLGYPAVPGVVKPKRGVAARIAKLRAHVGGPVPPALALFWRRVGGISLLDLQTYAHARFWRSRIVMGRPGYCDGVYIYACDDEWLDFAIGEYDEWREEGYAEPFTLSLAPDGYHKDNISGGAPYGMPLQSSWLAPLESFSWSGRRGPRSAPKGACDLLSYLRCSLLECAGFPGLYGIPAFESLRVELLEGVPLF
jgi:hypothetical protein